MIEKNIITSLIFAALFLLFSFSSAQTPPEFLVSWRTSNFVPADYQGKIFPTKDSRIQIGFDLLDNGKIADLSESEIQWILDNRTAAKGIGLNTFLFDVKKSAGNDHVLRIAVSDYKGEELTEIVTIPSVSPEIVIEYPSPYSLISLGQNNLRAWPYFFNISNLNELNFKWLINGQAAQGNPANPDILNLDLDSEIFPIGTPINIRAIIRNAFNQLESAVQSINLTVR